MSMYNMLFGMNPFAKVLLAILGTDESRVPRFRDCYLDEDGNIIIYTRTGGGNRDWYEEPNEENKGEGNFNCDLRKLEGFISDEDDDFDSTYAYFKFKAPEKASEVLEEIKALGGTDNPNKKWTESLEKLRSGATDQSTKEMLDRVAPVMKNLFSKLEEGKSGVVEV